MASRESRQTDPLQDLFVDIKKILDFMEVKDANEAFKYETPEIYDRAAMWMNAKLGADTYVTYKNYWNYAMFQEVLPNVKLNNIKYWMEHPYNVPVDFREHLLEKGRQAFMDSYEEGNEYYRMLNGLPPIDTPPSEFIYLTEPMRNQLHASDQPVHLLSPLIQNSYINTDEYKAVVAANPDKKYLSYIGIYKIDIFAARKAKDFDIIRYSLNRSDINPHLISQFASLYDDYREYVMTTLYNSAFETMYENYRNFMGLLIQTFVLLQICNKATEALNSRAFLDDTVLHIILSMHDIPKSLLMTNEVRRNLVINMLQLTREKGTDDVYYDLVKILGYQDVVISKLMLMKGQQFGENGKVLEGQVKPYFVQVDLKDTNSYETIATGEAPIHDYHKIIDNDPTWWDLPDTRAILENSEYTVADSKYIMIEAVVHQIKYMFEAIYFARMILDNKSSTDTFMIEIPELFGTEPMSIYDLMVFIVAATCMNNGLTGEINCDESKLVATAGFNFDLDLDSFMEYLDTTKYVDKDRVKEFMSNLTIRNPRDINRMFNDVMYPMREWLEQKIAGATSKGEYVEYESLYRAFYTYDIKKNSFSKDFKPPMDVIRDKYGLTDEEIRMFKHFYPRTYDGKALTVETYPEARKDNQPFISRLNLVDWYIYITLDTPRGKDNRGYVYFHDILNMADLRELTNPDGTRVFMDWEDGDIGWQINRQAVEKAIELIDALDEKALHKGIFQVDTPILNSGGLQYNEGDRLPANIRGGLYKSILKEKLMMDLEGLAVPPVTYLDYLYRKNTKLYNLLVGQRRFELYHEGWLEDVMKVVLAVETNLNMHMKYFEQSVVGPDQFFKPLVALIKHFKSTFVNFAKTGLKYVFGDKIDAGGNSNMFKLFDSVQFIVHFVTLHNNDFTSFFGFYDTEHSMKHHIVLNDRSEILRAAFNGYKTNVRTACMGSLHLVDEMKFFKNGEPLDHSGNPSYWIPGEPGTGRWSEEDDILMRIRKESARVKTDPVDLEGWKDFVESYSPIE